MLLGEPEQTQGDINFPLLGIPVRIHPFFWLVALVLGASSRDISGALIWVAVLLISILFHELGHATAYRLFGLHPWITLYGMGGLTACSSAEESRSKAATTTGRIFVSLAGPGAGFLLAGLIIAGILASGHRVFFFPLGSFWPWFLTDLIVSQTFTMFIWQMLFFNIIWGLVNLLPVYPLDGGQIAREIFLKLNPHDGIRQSLILSMITAAALAAFAMLEWRELFVALLFGYLAFSSFMAMQAYTRRGPW